MHDSARREIQRILDVYASSTELILDIGSYDVNGNLREDVTSRGHRYVGLDIRPGPNVDVVTASPYGYPFSSASFDIALSVSTAYAIPDLARWFHEVARLLVPNGFFAIVTPTWSKPPTVQPPKDLWRVMPDGLDYLFAQTNRFAKWDVAIVETDVVGIAWRSA